MTWHLFLLNTINSYWIRLRSSQIQLPTALFICYHTSYIIYTHLLYSKSSTQILYSNSDLPHFTLSLSLSSKLLATFPSAHHRNLTREIIGPSSAKHGWPWWCISTTIHGWGHLLQPHCSWESLVNETVGPTTPLHTNLGPQLHWWNFSLTIGGTLVYLLFSFLWCFCKACKSLRPYTLESPCPRPMWYCWSF